MKNKAVVIGVLLTTLVLAGVAMFTAFRLYQTRNQAITPNAPSSRPAAATPTASSVTSCSLSFSLTTTTVTPTPTSTGSGSGSPSPTATVTSSPSPTATVTASPSPVPQCNYACTANSQCPSGLICYIPNGQTAGNCRNTQCLTESDCICNLPSATPTITSTPQLPEAGTSWPTILGIGTGVLILIASLLFAL